MKDKEKMMQEQLGIIDSLLRDKNFSYAMAVALNAAYYTGIGEKPKPFLAPGEDTAVIRKSAREEKVATTIAGFYALECSLGMINATSDKAPVEVLQMIADNKVDTADALILNRFANATWKASQPFRSLDRITRPIFMLANFLPEDEVKKDYDQIRSAAHYTLAAMQQVKDQSKQMQFEKLRTLMQDTTFVVRLAKAQDSSYYASQHQNVPEFMSSSDSDTIAKSVKEQKVATNLAGFYALECGICYLVTTKNELPSEILKSIINGSLSDADKNTFSRFANATWKAGQPFNDLNRITRDAFVPFDFLPQAEKEKDMLQIRAAAVKLLPQLQK